MANKKTRKRKKSLTFEINNLTRVLLLFVAVFLALCFLTTGMGKVGEVINNSFYFAFGNGSIIIPILLIFIAINSYLNSIETSDVFLVLSAILFLIVSVSF